MKRKPNLSPEERDWRRILTAMISISIAALAALIFLLCYEEPITFPSAEAEELWDALIFLAISLPCLVLLFWGLWSVLWVLDRPAVKTGAHLLAGFLSRKIALKNARVVYPCLQYFLFFVLSRNREFLQIPLGQDASSLTPQGYAPAYRSRCVFYRFQLVMPDKPEMDEKTMRLVLQNYITGELMNYGISGLSSCYLDPKIGRIPSVFIDRVFFDEAAHYLTLDVLYVCTAEAAEYVKKAIHMDSAPKQPDRTVYDDEAR